jgi:hypothetical protein
VGSPPFSPITGESGFWLESARPDPPERLLLKVIAELPGAAATKILDIHAPPRPRILCRKAPA